jgi:hypothetical protein
MNVFYLPFRENRLILCLTLKNKEMNTVLKLNLEDKVFAQVKNLAQEQKISLSELIENYLVSLVDAEKPKEKTINPVVRELTGVIPSTEAGDYEKEYQDYLSKKYL